MSESYSSTQFLNEGCAPIGIESLDKELRGLEKGSIVAIVGDPMSQAPLFLRHLAATGITDYFSTYQPLKTIEEKLLRIQDVKQENLNLYDIYDSTSSQVSTQQLIKQLNQETGDDALSQNLIIDSITSLPDLEMYYTELIRALHNTAPKREGLTYIYLARDGIEDLTEQEKEILHASDSVIQLRTEVRGENIYHEFILKKSVGKTVPEETIRLNYGETITINTATSH